MLISREALVKKSSDRSRQYEQLGEASRSFILLSGSTLLILILISFGILLQGKWSNQPVFKMKGLSPAISSQFFADMLHMEIPGFSVAEDEESYTFSNNNVFTFLVQWLTSVNPKDPRTLIAGAVPGIRDDIVPLKGQGGQLASPADYAPPAADHSGEQSSSHDRPEGDESPIGDEITIIEEPDAPDESSAGNGQSESGAGGGPLTTGNKKVVFIYHSHSRESWVPELAHKGVTEIRDAEDAEVNITMVGERLAQQLTDSGIGTTHSKTDYPTAVKNYNWNFSYKYSQQTVKTAMANNKELKFFFDIHRDSQRREITTTEINGQSYAQVFFIVGLKNPNWEKNEAFATQIHDALEAKYPGLSRGIWGKGKNDGNGEYNQSLSTNSMVIEIGGPENTLEESYRTADALADVIADIYWDAEQVDSNG